ncbi:GTP-binding protein TypA, putative [Eimeria brunetti]|uniref:GTP-binding protein TypA, putative n=1 Tax=Eimeria brunetti TaxID=51314 RepID=U6LRQ7_9EIME|nr:GTP-binding protein TypA, putative [Eimeria brunetti]
MRWGLLFVKFKTAAAAAAAAAAPAAAAAGAVQSRGLDEDEEEEEELLLLQQQQQQQQRLPKEGEKQQNSSRPTLTIKKQIEGPQERRRGFLVAIEAGEATVKGIMHAQERGEVFVSPGDEVYAGMLVGLHKRPNDLPVNICKAKKLTNMRSATKTITEGLIPPKKINLDAALDLIGPGEIVEVTPKHIRMALRSAMRS